MSNTNQAISNDEFVKDNDGQELNADFSVPVIIECKLFDEQSLPNTNRKRVCLERIYRKNKLRLTMLENFSAGQKVNHRCDGGGVEFLVLSGVAASVDTNYRAGCYVRNSAGVKKNLYAMNDCTILFKSGQCQSSGGDPVYFDTLASDEKWQSARDPGVFFFDLYCDAVETVKLYRIRPECWVTFHDKKQGVELFVYDGSIFVDGKQYNKGTWLRYPIASKIKVLTKIGAELYVKTRIFPVNLWYK